MLVYVVIAVPATALGLWWMRRNYRTLGRLSLPGLSALLVMFFIPHLALDAAIEYRPLSSPIALVGITLAALGLVVCGWAIVVFRSVKKMFCLDHGALTTAGPYRWSRNPQYVGYSIFLLGFALIGWTPECMIALALYATIVHAMVLTEERHLARVFGDAYTVFRNRTPRYLGWPFPAGRQRARDRSQ